MSEASLSISKAAKDHYRLSFDTESGVVTCEVSVRQPGRSDTRTNDEKRVAALHKAKRLARAFYESIHED